MRGRLPFFIATAIVLAHVALMMRAALHNTGGEFTYPLDDPYIHLAIARHVAFDGVYGVTRFAFTTAASSIGWPFLLAALMKVFGAHASLGFFVNVVAAVALVWVVSSGLAREAPRSSDAARTLWLVLVMILVPVATLVAFGMEHVLHAALTIAFVLEGARVVEGEERRLSKLVALAVALVCTRYEGLFPIVTVAALLLLRRRIVPAATLGAASALPALAFGTWSLLHGAGFLPNSIAIKRQYFSLTDPDDVLSLMGGKLAEQITIERYLVPLFLGLLVLLVYEVRAGWRWSKSVVRIVVALVTTIAHVELTSHNWFFRYEAYVIALDLTVIAAAMLDILPDMSAFRRACREVPVATAAALAAATVAIIPLASRAGDAQGNTPIACRNIHEQQIQTARFLNKYFPNDPVAINDIGAVAFYGDSPIIDLLGLADQRVARAKKMQFDVPLTFDQVGELSAEAPVAVVYDSWVPHPPTWVRLGVLRIDVNHSAAWPSVSVYATSPDHVPRVMAALRDFAPSLPTGVRREGRFVETGPPAPDAPYVADTGDVLYVDVKGAPEVSTLAPIGSDGSFYLPKGGEVKARGLALDAVVEATRAELKKTAAKRPDTRAREGEATVRLIEPRRPTYIIAGNVVRPGQFLVDLTETARGALAMAGGVSKPSKEEPYVLRESEGGFERLPLDAASADVSLRAGDFVMVP